MVIFVRRSGDATASKAVLSCLGNKMQREPRIQVLLLSLNLVMVPRPYSAIQLPEH